MRFSSWFCHTWACGKWRNYPSFWARSSSCQPFRFFADQHSGVSVEPKWRLSLTRCWCVWPYPIGVQIFGKMANCLGWGEQGHTLIVMVGEYYGGTGKRGFKHSSTQLARVGSDTSNPWMCLYRRFNVLQQYREVSRGEELARKQTHVLTLKGVEEVSTQLAVIPRGPRRIANAT